MRVINKESVSDLRGRAIQASGKVSSKALKIELNPFKEKEGKSPWDWHVENDKRLALNEVGVVGVAR